MSTVTENACKFILFLVDVGEIPMKRRDRLENNQIILQTNIIHAKV